MELVTTTVYDKWFVGLKDIAGQARIATRVRRLANGNPGLHRSVGSGVLELKIDFGPGYRVYYTRSGNTVTLLLCGGDKGSQWKDIERAKKMALELEARQEE